MEQRDLEGHAGAVGSEFKVRGEAEALRANAKDRGPGTQRRSHLPWASAGVPAGAGAAPAGAEGQRGRSRR